MVPTSDIHDWQRVAVRREGNLLHRVIMIALVVVMASIAIGEPDPVCITLGVLAVLAQLIDLANWRAIARRPAELGRFGIGITLVTGFAITALCAAILATVWLRNEPGRELFFFFILVAAIQRTIAYSKEIALNAAVTVSPLVLVGLAFPIASIIRPDDLGAPQAAMALFAFLTLLVYHYSSLRQVARLSHISEVRRQEAEAERKAAEKAQLRAILQRRQAERASLAKSDFLATMSHEIRTPLNAVLGMAQALDAEELPARSKEKIGTILSSGSLLLQLLNDLLDVSKIEAGALTLEERAIDLGAIMERVRQLHAESAERKGIALAVGVEPTLNSIRIGDEHRMLQVLHNLVSNAVKFTDEGRVGISLRAGAGPDRIRLSVTDTGIGMTPAQAARMGEAFTQADSSVTRRYGGSGLGISIVRGLATAMGGEFDIVSAPGEGTTVTLELRLPPSEKAADVPTVPAGRPKGTFRGVRVLAVDDNPTNLMVMRSLLSPMGVAVSTAESGQEAIEAVAGARFDLVFMDISMPGMDGTKAMKEIRWQTGTDAPTIFAATAHALTHEVQGFLAVGFDGCITKPLTIARLEEALVCATERREGQAGADIA